MIKETIGTDDVVVGSYSLETLTTGMYENPLHCIREYVQNAYDAIRAARTQGLCEPTAGLVSISISGTAKRPTISIRDDGTGIAASDAVRTLVSIGASRKRSKANAGFRGIGRLAGIAYCTTLRFTTTAKDEDTATVVEFDCGRMRGFMRPGAEVQDVRDMMRLCVKIGSSRASAEAHSTEVEMIGLTGIGLEFAEIELLVPYLRQVCPIEYSDRFSQAARIRAFSEGVGHPIDAVEVETRYKRERTQILKAYDDVTPTSDPKRPSTIGDVEFLTSPELGWFGWIGKSNFKGELTDDMVAGIRFRLRNIQVGGSDLIESLGAELTNGGTEGRLQRWAIGEIFITNPSVVPNARRDGFEDGTAWREIRNDVKSKVARRVVSLVRAASNSRKILKSIASETKSVAGALEVDPVDEATAERTLAAIGRLLDRLRPDKLTGGDPNEIGEQTSRLKALKDKVVALRARAKPEKRPVQERADEEEAVEDEAEASAAGKREKAGTTGMPPSAEDLLEAVARILNEELGEAETARLFALARESLVRDV